MSLNEDDLDLYLSTDYSRYTISSSVKIKKLDLDGVDIRKKYKENKDEGETIYDISCPIDTQVKISPNIDFNPEELTDEEKAVFEALEDDKNTEYEDLEDSFVLLANDREIPMVLKKNIKDIFIEETKKFKDNDISFNELKKVVINDLAKFQKESKQIDSRLDNEKNVISKDKVFNQKIITQIHVEETPGGGKVIFQTIKKNSSVLKKLNTENKNNLFSAPIYEIASQPEDKLFKETINEDFSMSEEDIPLTQTELNDLYSQYFNSRKSDKYKEKNESDDAKESYEEFEEVEDINVGSCNLLLNKYDFENDPFIKKEAEIHSSESEEESVLCHRKKTVCLLAPQKSNEKNVYSVIISPEELNDKSLPLQKNASKNQTPSIIAIDMKSKDLSYNPKQTEDEKIKRKTLIKEVKALRKQKKELIKKAIKETKTKLLNLDKSKANSSIKSGYSVRVI